MFDIVGRYAFLAITISAFLPLGSCATVRYDDELDSQLTTAESDFHTLSSNILSAATEVELLSPRKDHLFDAELANAEKKLTYAANAAAYDKVRVDLLNLRVRANADAGPTHSQLNSAIGAIEDNILGSKSMRETHMQQNRLSAQYVKLEEQIIDAQFAALGTYVAITKEGSSSSTSK